jgi:catechol 2,3-dioxygenase-like lactoylglutathione lyase family enzyme
VISGAHVIIYSTDAEADRAFLRDVLGLPGVDAGDGWLILALPSSEVAVHPAESGDRHELFLMTDDVALLVTVLRRGGTACTDPEDLGWGVLTRVTLPGGGHLGVYQPRHPHPDGRSA